MTEGYQTTIRSSVAHPNAVAKAIQPDNTTDVQTTVEDGQVVTRLRRTSASSLEATIDDYLLNLDVATHVAQLVNDYTSNTKS